MGLLVVGSVALDSVKTPFGEVKDVLGGSATYFATSASFFTRVRLVAVIGSDFPQKHLSFLQKRNIDLSGLERKKGKTFRWKGEYDYTLEDARTLSTCLNVFGKFNPRLPEDYRRSRYLFLSNIDPALQEYVLRQVAAPKVVACDSMNFWIENKKKGLIKVLKKVDIFFANEAEARELTGEADLLKAGRSILTLGPRAVVIKKGEHGALLIGRDFSFAAPGFLLESITDTTGAGDSFAGGFMGSLVRAGNLTATNIRRAVIYGNVLASFAVEEFSLGGLKGLTRERVEKRYREYKRLSRF